MTVAHASRPMAGLTSATPVPCVTISVRVTWAVIFGRDGVIFDVVPVDSAAAYRAPFSCSAR